MIKRNRDPLCVRKGFAHQPQPKNSTSCVHLIKHSEMTDLCATLPEDVTLEINDISTSFYTDIGPDSFLKSGTVHTSQTYSGKRL